MHRAAWEVDWAAVGGVLMVIALLGLIAAAAVGLAWLGKRQRAEDEARLAARWQDLCRRFGQRDAQRILGREVWQGQTHEMLIEALGPPATVSEDVLKTRVRRVYKYRQIAANRYALHVTLDNGIVVGWKA